MGGYVSSVVTAATPALAPEMRRPASGTASPFSRRRSRASPKLEGPSGFVGPGGGSAARVVSAVLARGMLVVVVRAGLAVVRGAGGPAGEQAQCVVRGGAGFSGVGEQALAGFGGDGEGLVGEIKVPDDRVADELDAGVWSRTLRAAHRTRNWSLRVDSSPIRSDSPRS